MSDKDQAQPSTPGREQTRDGAAPQPGERTVGAEGGGGRGRSSSSSSGGRHGGRRRHGGGQQQQSAQAGGQQRRPENSLNMEELRDLMDLFSSHGLTDFEFENEEIRVRLSRNLVPQASAPQPHGAHLTTAEGGHQTVSGAAHGSSSRGGAGGAAAETARAEDKAEELHIITSPIVGTFYRAPSPASEPFVKQGSQVEPDTIVCIIEAMKLMNEIQSETTGVVEKIYVENGQPVEYGQPLFGIKK
jgi:acetyl-CoA carboxylase biotin carboxyl carrier protein